MTSKSLVLRIRMTHSITSREVTFRWDDTGKNNALDQLESELRRIVEEEVTARLAAMATQQLAREEAMRDGI